MERWVGKVAVVTGASSGIGHAIASTLVKKGLIVVGAARRYERIIQLAKELETNNEKGKLYAMKTDMTKEEDIILLFAWVQDNLGGVDILINNAGVNAVSSLLNGKTEEWRKVFDINLVGLSIATREATKSMINRNVNGHIIHISSLLGHKIPAFGAAFFNVYPASKHGVQALADVLHAELRAQNKNIKVTTVCPSLTDTEIINDDKVHEILRPLLKTCPKMSSQDIADVVAYVLSTPPHLEIRDIVVAHVEDKDF